MGAYVMLGLVLFIAVVVAPVVCRIEDGRWPWSRPKRSEEK